MQTPALLFLVDALERLDHLAALIIVDLQAYSHAQAPRWDADNES